MKVGYVRVSTIEQNDKRQIEGLEKYEIEEWFIEKVSAKDTNRPKLKEMLKFIRKGDTVYVWDLSRLARSTKDLLEILEMFEEKEVSLVSEKEKFDTSTAMGKMLITIVAAMNEFERKNLLERQREGIAIAKKEGKYKGRKKIDRPENWEEVYSKWKQREITSNKAMELLNLKRNTFYKLIKEYEDDR